MDQNEVEPVARERRRVDVALAQLDPMEAGAFEVGARHRQHGVAGVEPERPPGAWGEKLQHPPRPRAEVEQGADRFIPKRVKNRSLDRLL